MRAHRIYTQNPLLTDSEVSLRGRQAHYLGRVLRVVRGQTVVLFNGDGHDYPAEVLAAGKAEIRLRLTTRLWVNIESPLRVTLAQAVCRGERMDHSLQKSTELGAAAFQPIISERVEVKLSGAKLSRRLAHWNGVVTSACEQCGRAVIPAVHEPQSLSEFLAGNTGDDRVALTPGVKLALAGMNTGSRLTVFVGPEGGFSQPERELIRHSGVVEASLGPRTLRAETAGPAALAVLQATAGDFR